MTRMWLCASLCLLADHSAAAQPTHFGFKPIIVNGSSDVFVTAINDRSMIAGIYASGGQAYGFTSSGTSFITIPFVCSPFGTIQCVPVPSAINRHGLVAGVAFTPQNFEEEATYFTWQAGDAAPAILTDSAALGEILLNDKNGVALPCYTYVYPYQLTQCGVFAGLIPNIGLVKGLNDAATAQSLNRAGALAGIQPLMLHGEQVQAGFLVSGGKVHSVLPPQATGVGSLVINDEFQLAGSYRDAAGLWHGFTQHGGQTTVFDLPTRNTPIVVTDENNSGRVVGYFGELPNGFYPFLYNGVAAQRITDKPFSQTYPSIRINDEGTMILGNDVGSTAPFGSRSYRVLCAGPGC